jgi:UDP:flavonoid glycosyltransferase YjiC (YdhE family)
MGGPVSAAEAMYHGVPLLMITQGSPDLEVYSENAARLGIGCHLRKTETTVNTIRDSALRILGDGAIADRMEQIQRIVRREPGAEDTANCIEEYLLDTID